MKKHTDIYKVIDSEIDEKILPLIKAMNALPWIQTNSSCFGHENHEVHDQFYVQFFCDNSKIEELSQVLNTVDNICLEGRIPISISCQLNFNSEVAGSQADAPEGSIAFYLTIEEYAPLTNQEKLIFVDILTKEFQKLI